MQLFQKYLFDYYKPFIDKNKFSIRYYNLSLSKKVKLKRKVKKFISLNFVIVK